MEQKHATITKHISLKIYMESSVDVIHSHSIDPSHSPPF